MIVVQLDETSLGLAYWITKNEFIPPKYQVALENQRFEEALHLQKRRVFIVCVVPSIGNEAVCSLASQIDNHPMSD